MLLYVESVWHRRIANMSSSSAGSMTGEETDSPPAPLGAVVHLEILPPQNKTAPPRLSSHKAVDGHGAPSKLSILQRRYPCVAGTAVPCFIDGFASPDCSVFMGEVAYSRYNQNNVMSAQQLGMRYVVVGIAAVAGQDAPS
jgi:hypothetical protein